MKKTTGYGVYFDPNKTTSGQRFYANLCRCLSEDAKSWDELPEVVLFNVSGQIWEILKAKLRGQKIVLRIDGLYYDRLSRGFIRSLPWGIRWLFSLGLRFTLLHDPLAHIANYVNQNYKVFSRIQLSDFVIYQSNWSKRAYQRYFPKKPCSVIVNGAQYVDGFSRLAARVEDDDIRLCTIYSEKKPRKRMCELIAFARWVREERKLPIRLAILGYTGRLPVGAPEGMRNWIEERDYIECYPPFGEIEGCTAEILRSSDMFISFTNRDPCPNVVVEAMSHGLPVVGFASGGLPDIVGDAGILLEDKDSDAFFASARYENEFHEIDYEIVLNSVLDIKSQLPLYKARVKKRFTDDLNINIVAARYADTLSKLLATMQKERGPL